MHAAVGVDLDIGLHARRQLIAGAQRAAILVVISVVIAGGRAVGELRTLIGGALDVAFDRQIEPIELLTKAGAAADGGEDRKLGEAGLQIRTAGIVGRDQQTAVEIDARVAGDVDAAVHLAVEIGPAQRRRLVRTVAGIAAAQIGLELVPRPVRLRQQFRRDGVERGALAARRAPGVAVVAADQFDRRIEREGAGTHAERRVRIFGLVHAPCVSSGAYGSGRVRPAARRAPGRKRRRRSRPAASDRAKRQSAPAIRARPLERSVARFVGDLALTLALAFLRLLVESKPVMPAPDAGAAKFAGGPSCTSDGRLNCWKRGGLRGSVCSFGVSGSVTAADCAMASALQIATQTAASRRALARHDRTWGT